MVQEEINGWVRWNETAAKSANWTVANAIEAAVGHPPRAFAYPNGGEADYTAEVVDLVRAAGFTCAVTTKFGMNTESTSPWELRRGQPWEEDLPRFALKLAWYGLTLR